MAGEQRGLSRERVSRRRRFRVGGRAAQAREAVADQHGASAGGRADGGGEAAALDTIRD